MFYADLIRNSNFYTKYSVVCHSLSLFSPLKVTKLFFTKSYFQYKLLSSEKNEIRRCKCKTDTKKGRKKQVILAATWAL